MADNVNITSGTGTAIATDDVGSVHYQKVKLDAGGDGVAVPIVAGQQAKAASLPVVLASDQDALAVTGTFYPVTQPVSIADPVAVTNADLSTIAGAVSGTHMQADIAGALPTGTNVIGLVGASDIVVTVTPTLDTNIYASGDLLFDSTEIANAVRANGYCAILESVTIIDKADQGVEFTLLIADTATDFGTLNGAPDPDDTECATVIGWVPVATADYVGLGGATVACIRNIGLLCRAGAATTSLYVAGVNGASAATYAASSLVIQLGFLRS